MCEANAMTSPHTLEMPDIRLVCRRGASSADSASESADGVSESADTTFCVRVCSHMSLVCRHVDLICRRVPGVRSLQKLVGVCRFRPSANSRLMCEYVCMCFAPSSFLPSVPGCARHADLLIKTSPVVPVRACSPKTLVFLRFCED